MAVTGAAVIDHIGKPGDPYRVTLIRLGRKAETYELRWRETIHDENSGPPVRERRATPGGYTKAEAYTRAEKVYRSLERSDGRTGAPPRPLAATRTRTPKTLRQVSELWLAQHPGKPATIENYRSLMSTCIWPELTWTDTSTRRGIVHRIELGVMAVEDLQPADINTWLKALAHKPDARRKPARRSPTNAASGARATVPVVSSSTVKTGLTVLAACLTWDVAHGHLHRNPAVGASVTVHHARQPEWFRTPDHFWTALEHTPPVLHTALITAAYLGLRLGELAALQWDDVDLRHHRVLIRHNLDKKRRPSTVKSEESETWMPLHPEAETAITTERDRHTSPPPGHARIFHGPRAGILTSTLLNDTLAKACRDADLGYRVTAHGLRHSFANWLKTAGVPTRDIQEVLRHRDQRTTSNYLHTSSTEKILAINKLPGRPQPNAS
jgi:integrase